MQVKLTSPYGHASGHAWVSGVEIQPLRPSSSASLIISKSSLISHQYMPRLTNRKLLSIGKWKLYITRLSGGFVVGGGWSAEEYLAAFAASYDQSELSSREVHADLYIGNRLEFELFGELLPSGTTRTQVGSMVENVVEQWLFVLGQRSTKTESAVDK
jgi:hypothetical protein